MANFAPTATENRLAALDVLRGAAVLGILVMNVQSYSMVGAAYLNPTVDLPAVKGDFEGANYLVWLLSHVLADQKFMTIFSLLFGAGVALMAQRQEAKGLAVAPLHFRRMGWLLVIGLLHAYLLWYGDILVSYVLCGVVVFWLRKAPPWLLLVLGGLTISVASGINVLSGLSVAFWPDEMVEEFEAQEWSPPRERIEQEITLYRGSWLEQMPHRAKAALSFETFLFLIYTFWRAGGLMLIGMALYRWGVFGGEQPTWVYALMTAIGLLVGIPLISFGVQQNFAAEWNVRYSFFLGGQFNYWGSLFVGLGYVGAVMLFCQVGRLAPLQRALADVGRMALTNYLMQSILCTTIFYGHGFGQFARFSRVEQITTVLAIWLVQLIASGIWLRFFRFGPFEWAWRSLSYWRVQPLWLIDHPNSPRHDRWLEDQ